MKVMLSNPKRQARVLLFLALAILCMPLQTAHAQDSITNGLVPADQTVQGSLFLFAPQVTIAGIVDGDVFAIGQDVTLTGEIKGSLFILGTVATIDGQLAGDLYTANSRLTLGPTASIGRSIYAAAGIISLQAGSQVARDLYLIALSGELSSSIGRYSRAHLGFLELLTLIFGDNGLLRPVLPPDFRLPFSTTDSLALQPAERIHWLPLASAGWLPSLALHPVFGPPPQTAPLASAELGNWLLAQLRVFAPLFLIGLILIWLFPRFLQGSVENLRSRPLGSLGTGVVAFFVGYGIAGLVLALVIALGFFFASIQYWDLALITWGGGLGGLSLAMALFSLAIIYLSKILVAYLFGALLLGRLPLTVWGRRIWMLLLGLMLGVLLLSIPILGWVISVLATMFGLGAIYLYLRKPRPAGQTSIQSQPAANLADQSGPALPLATVSSLEDHGEVEPEIIAAKPSEDLIQEEVPVSDTPMVFTFKDRGETPAELFVATPPKDQIPEETPISDLLTESLSAENQEIEPQTEALSETDEAASTENLGESSMPMPKRPRRRQ